MTESANSSAAALRAVAIMETVARANRPLALSDIAASCGLPAPTAFRILGLLEGAGLIQREPTGKTYGIGHRLARLGLDVMSNNDPRGERRAILRRVVDDIGETCNLAMLNGDEIVYIDRVETDWSLKAELKPGSRVPLHCTSSGKLFLSQMPKAKRRRMLESLSLKRYTDNTVTDIALLEAQIDDIAETRVGVNNEELQAGVIGLAVPVVGADGRMIATVALQAPVARLPMARAMDCVPRLLEAARDMAATFARRRRLKGPSHRRTPVSSALVFWIPAFAGMTMAQNRRSASADFLARVSQLHAAASTGTQASIAAVAMTCVVPFSGSCTLRPPRTARTSALPRGSSAATPPYPPCPAAARRWSPARACGRGPCPASGTS
jgi:IclR family acetate operon transcriptional repressor